MKRIYYSILATAILAVMIAACGGRSGSGGGSGSKNSAKLTMTTEEGGNFSFTLYGSGVATVDWGDGSEKVSLTLSEHRVAFRHTYPNATIRTISINGDNITGLQCYDITNLDVSRCTELEILSCHGQFKSLDVSRNTALKSLTVGHKLTSLDVSKNTALILLDVFCSQLTSLDVSKNTALIELRVSSQLTSLDVSRNTALKRLDVSGQLTSSALNALFRTLHSNAGEKYINIYNNPGANDCDRSIAESKGWTFR